MTFLDVFDEPVIEFKFESDLSHYFRGAYFDDADLCLPKEDHAYDEKTATASVELPDGKYEAFALPDELIFPGDMY